MIPNRFFIVGAQRCATTYLHKILDEHPDICMAKPIHPEPKFFFRDDEFSKGIAYYDKTYFSDCKDALIWGEKSTSYIEYESAARRIKNCFPASKIIISLRNPVHRALANYFYTRRSGLEQRSLQEVFIEKKPPLKSYPNVSIDPFDYLGRGEYMKFIRMYLKYFDRNSLLILIKDRFIDNPDGIQNIYRFLNANDNFLPESRKYRYNELGERIEQDDMGLSEVDENISVHLSGYYEKHIRELENFLGTELIEWRQTSIPQPAASRAV